MLRWTGHVGWAYVATHNPRRPLGVFELPGATRWSESGAQMSQSAGVGDQIWVNETVEQSYHWHLSPFAGFVFFVAETLGHDVVDTESAPQKYAHLAVLTCYFWSVVVHTR